MSYFIDRITYFSHERESFSNGHGITTDENRGWEKGYRDRWAHDKVVRSTHGVNCTGSCSWKIYVKNGLITWETQICQTMSRVAVHGERAIAGIFILPIV